MSGNNERALTDVWQRDLTGGGVPKVQTYHVRTSGEDELAESLIVVARSEDEAAGIAERMLQSFDPDEAAEWFAAELKASDDGWAR